MQQLFNDCAGSFFGSAEYMSILMIFKGFCIEVALGADSVKSGKLKTIHIQVKLHHQNHISRSSGVDLQDIQKKILRLKGFGTFKESKSDKVPKKDLCFPHQSPEF